MSNAAVRTHLLTMRSEIDRALAELDAEPAANAPAPEFMKLQAYAVRRGVAYSTIKRWRKLGLPCRVKGRVVRVIVADADKWDEDSVPRNLAERDAAPRASR